MGTVREGPPTAAREPAPLLDAELLHQLERALQAHGVPIPAASRPGLSVDVMRDLGTRHGIRLPQEALTWWGWRDLRGLRLLSAHQYLPLAVALDQYRRRRDQAKEAATEPGTAVLLRDPDIWWHHSWVPLFATGGGQTVTLDCDVPDDAPSPIRNIDWERISEDDYDWPIADSLAAHLAGCLETLETGRYTYHAAWGVWRSDPSSGDQT
jgi:hypothetical protein